MVLHNEQASRADPPRKVHSRPTRVESPETTAALLESAGAGDERAWKALVDRYSGLVWMVVRTYRLDEQTAADIAQTTWFRLLQNLGRIREPKALGSWLATTARRECLRALQRAGRERPIGDDHLMETVAPPAQGPEAQVLADEMSQTLRRFVDELPERCRALLTLLMADPRPTYNEVSATLDMPMGSIGPTQARCVSCLRRRLERAGLMKELVNA